MLRTALFGAALLASLGLMCAAPAQAKPKRYHHSHFQQTQPRYVYRHKRVPIGGGYGPGTYAAGPRSYGGNPAYYGNVPRGRPDTFQRNNGCYGGREQVRRGGRLIWVPNVTCPYYPDNF